MTSNQRKPVGSPILSGRSFMYMESGYVPTVLRLHLKEHVDPERLQSAVDQALLVHPWAAYGICLENGTFYYHDGLTKSLTVSEADWSDSPVIGGDHAGGHLAGIYYKGRTITLMFSHGLTDGSGIFSFAEEMLRAYAAYSRGEDYTPDTPPYDDVNAEPLEVVNSVYERMQLPAINTGSAGAGTKPSFLVPKRFETGTARPCHHMIKADAADYMRFAKACGVRPVSVLVSTYAKAILKVMGNTQQHFRVAVPADFRKALEIPHTFRNCAVPPLMLDLSPELVNGDIRILASAVQKIINGMTTRSAEVTMTKAMADAFRQIPPLPYRQGAEMFSHFTGGPMFTFNASYARRLPDSDLTALLESAYMSFPSEGDQTVLEMTALPESFCICLSQGENTGHYADAFCSVLSENGISCMHEGVLQGNMGYIELREYERW
ncbi:MAG: hypothetical protein IJ242_09260 [Clostridia bacterium]|nr:hypothetical protein [Clostridia bacterium]